MLAEETSQEYHCWVSGGKFFVDELGAWPKEAKIAVRHKETWRNTESWWVIFVPKKPQAVAVKTPISRIKRRTTVVKPLSDLNCEDVLYQSVAQSLSLASFGLNSFFHIITTWCTHIFNKEQMSLPVHICFKPKPMLSSKPLLVLIGMVKAGGHGHRPVDLTWW